MWTFLPRYCIFLKTTLMAAPFMHGSAALYSVFCPTFSLFVVFCHRRRCYPEYPCRFILACISDWAGRHFSRLLKCGTECPFCLNKNPGKFLDSVLSLLLCPQEKSQAIWQVFEGLHDVVPSKASRTVLTALPHLVYDFISVNCL